jgi:glycosyltransferase involved in cell wall biosynthesis
MRTYWTAHGLATRGHEVHVVTNAKEAQPPFRMHMRTDDWKRCEAEYGTGSVTVHWTDPVDSSQSYIPMASPFVSKLAAVAARAHAAHSFDVVLSYYMEPYGVAGHLAAEMTGLPHVVRMAGSDAGRLWHHPQFEPLYDHVLRSCEVVIAAGKVAERAIQRSVDPGRIAFAGEFTVPEDLFAPEGPRLDLATLRSEAEKNPDLYNLLWGEFAADRPYFGVYGKLGESKGSFSLLTAMHRLKQDGLDIGLVALAHGQPEVQRNFRARARKLGLVDSVLQIPFLPHWRVPEFLRGCLAVCCLEQDFPIGFHTPIIPREVLLSGSCLVASTEVIRKLPAYGCLPHGYGCAAIDDVNDIEMLSDRLAAIVRDPDLTAAVGRRGREFARDLQRDMSFPQALEHILEAAAARQPPVSSTRESPRHMAIGSSDGRFTLTQLAAIAVNGANENHGTSRSTVGSADGIDLAQARELLATVERGILEGRMSLKPLAPAIRVEIAIAAAESEADHPGLANISDSLFRLRIRRWALAEGDLARLVPVRDPRLRLLQFDYDVSEYIGLPTIAELPASPAPHPSYIVAFGRSEEGGRDPLVIDGFTAGILALSDGTHTVAEIVKKLAHGRSPSGSNLNWIEYLFVHGLISLQDERVDFVPNLGSTVHVGT